MFMTFKCKRCRIIVMNPPNEYLEQCKDDCCPECSKQIAQAKLEAKDD